MKHLMRFSTLMTAVLMFVACRPEPVEVLLERDIVYTVDETTTTVHLRTDAEFDALLERFCDYAEGGSTVTFYNANRVSKSASKEATVFSTTSREEMKAWMRRMEDDGKTVTVSYDPSSGTYHGEAYATAPHPHASWIDLGLPSGTLWKSQNEWNEADNEHGLFTFDEAVEAYGDQLPDYAQLTELKDLCEWTWTDGGYEVTGPNGNSIFLPAEGFRQCNGHFESEGVYGMYWSSQSWSQEPDNGSAWYIYFFYYPDDEAHVLTNAYLKCQGLSVRLVQD